MIRTLLVLGVFELVLAPAIPSFPTPLAFAQEHTDATDPILDGPSPTIDVETPQIATDNSQALDLGDTPVTVMRTEPVATAQPSQPSSPPTALAPVAPSVTSTPTPVVVYPTRNGSRTEAQIRTELAQADYGGPWDLSSVLAAYDRATAPTPTPLPTPAPVLVPPAPTLDPVLASRCFQFAFDVTVTIAQRAGPGQGAVLASGEQALANACRQAALERGALGEGCFEFAATRTLQLSISAGGGISSDLIPALYRTCMG